MKKCRQFFRENQIFLFITGLIFLTAVIVSCADCFGEIPFSKDGYSIENSVQALLTDNRGVYVTDGSRTIVVTDASNTMQYIIAGGNADKTFEYADSLALDDETDTLYVLDYVYDATGNELVNQRLLQFSENGSHREILYESNPDGESESEIENWLDYPQLIDGTLYFSVLSMDGISVYCVDDTENPCAFMPYEDADLDVMDAAFTRDMEIAAVAMNGDIYCLRDGKAELVYNARDHDTEDYVSLITDIAYTPDGDLCFLDMGLRYVGILEKDGVTEVIPRGFFEEEPPASLAEAELYSTLNVTDSYITILSEKYTYDKATDENGYDYHISGLHTTDNTPVYRNAVNMPPYRNMMTLCLYIAIVLMAALIIYAVVKIVRFVRRTSFAQNSTQLLVLVTALLITVVVSYSIFDTCNERFVQENIRNLSNTAYLIDASVDKEILKQLNTPDMYSDPAYLEFDETINNILRNDANADSNIYLVVYRVYNNVICEVYSPGTMHNVLYPLAGTYSNSSEEAIANEGTMLFSEDYVLSAGSYSFVLLPTYDEEDNILAFYEVGTDYNLLAAENSALYRRILILTAMAVIIVMLLFSECSNAAAAFRARKLARKNKAPLPPEVLRPLVFMIFFTCNITTAFLPIYGTTLWNPDFPLPAEMAAALPLSMELIVSSLSALLCGSIIKKTGIRFPLCLGAISYIVGNLMSVFAENLWVLIAANSICGFGGGMLTVAVTTWIADFETEEQTNKGFIHYNAGYLAGMNCGTVIGSLLWENFSFDMAYYAAAGSAVVILILSIVIAGNLKSAEKDTTPRQKVSLRHFFTRRTVSYYLLCVLPYLVCASFLLYYFPVVAEENFLSATEISMAFLISGVISIYTGTTLGEPLIEYLGVKKSMTLAAFIYIIALFYAALNPSILSCYVVIVLFAVADSFGLSAQSVYFSGLNEVKEYGESRALGIDNTIGTIISASGSLIFGSILLLGEQMGLLIITCAFAVLTLIYVIGGKQLAQADTSDKQGHSTPEADLV